MLNLVFLVQALLHDTLSFYILLDSIFSYLVGDFAVIFRKEIDPHRFLGCVPAFGIRTTLASYN